MDVSVVEWLAWRTSNCGRIGAIGSSPSNGLRPNMWGQKGFNPLCQCVYIYVCIVKPDIQTIHRCSHTSTHTHTYICIYIYIWVCVCYACILSIFVINSDLYIGFVKIRILGKFLPVLDSIKIMRTKERKRKKKEKERKKERKKEIRLKISNYIEYLLSLSWVFFSVIMKENS